MLLECAPDGYYQAGSLAEGLHLCYDEKRKEVEE